MTNSFLPYAKQSINADDIASVSHSLEKDIITRGPTVQEFENTVAGYCGAKYAVVFNSGTSALVAAAAVIDTGPSDRVLTTPNTFVATSGSAMLRQAVPIFIDIDRSSGNMNMDQLILNLQQPLSRGRMIIMPVHFSGIAMDMQRLDSHIQNPDAVIIEDAAHALGSSYPSGEKVGSCAYSHMTIFSFHPAKTITTGEGGMVTTNDETLFHRLKRFRNNGIERESAYLRGESQPWYYEVCELSCNYNFTEMQAALGLSQLKRLEEFVDKRRQLMRIYRHLLKDLDGVQLFNEEHDERSAYHLCVVQIDFERLRTTRTEVMQKLFQRGIGTQYHYIPIYRFPFFQDRSGDLSPYFPEMEMYYKQGLSLPLYPDLTTVEVERVVTELKEALGGR